MFFVFTGRSPSPHLVLIQIPTIQMILKHGGYHLLFRYPQLYKYEFCNLNNPIYFQTDYNLLENSHLSFDLERKVSLARKPRAQNHSSLGDTLLPTRAPFSSIRHVGEISATTRGPSSKVTSSPEKTKSRLTRLNFRGESQGRGRPTAPSIQTLRAEVCGKIFLRAPSVRHTRLARGFPN